MSKKNSSRRRSGRVGDVHLGRRLTHGCGFLVFHPEGMPAMAAKTLLTELFSNILTMLVAAFLLSQALGTLTSFGSRVLFVALLGLVPFLSLSVSYWNWYGFPTGFTFSELVDQVGGFALAGLVLAAMVKR
jgi:hypothetical protein